MGRSTDGRGRLPPTRTAGALYIELFREPDSEYMISFYLTSLVPVVHVEYRSFV